MASLRKRHEEFIRELQAPLVSSDSLNKDSSNPSVKPPSNESESDKQLIAELQKRFDELFGPDDDDDD